MLIIRAGIPLTETNTLVDCFPGFHTRSLLPDFSIILFFNLIFQLHSFSSFAHSLSENMGVLCFLFFFSIDLETTGYDILSCTAEPNSSVGRGLMLPFYRARE